MLKVQEIRELIRLIDQSSINEFTYESSGTTITMKKAGGNGIISNQPQVVIPVEQNEEIFVSTVENAPQETKEEALKQANTTQESTQNYDYEIVSPMVGTFYCASSPDSEPYVKKGSRVEADTVVCIVEAMKLFNEIEAEVSGEIVEALVQDGELVEYGQPLFRVKKN